MKKGSRGKKAKAGACGLEELARTMDRGGGEVLDPLQKALALFPASSPSGDLKDLEGYAVGHFLAGLTTRIRRRSDKARALLRECAAVQD
jgi:hypothetical protein